MLHPWMLLQSEAQASRMTWHCPALLVHVIACNVLLALQCSKSLNRCTCLQKNCLPTLPLYSVVAYGMAQHTKN
jgi:hypothetical protein